VFGLAVCARRHYSIRGLSSHCKPPDAQLEGGTIPPVSSTQGLRSVSQLYLLLIVIGVLMTLAWIAVLVRAAIHLAQHVF
jgi:hypothetical protein